MSEHEAREALRSHFAARAEDIHPSAELARRVAAIRPPARRGRLPLRMAALALGAAAAGATAAAVVLTGHPAAAPQRTPPLAPPASTAPATVTDPSATTGSGPTRPGASASPSSTAHQQAHRRTEPTPSRGAAVSPH